MVLPMALLQTAVNHPMLIEVKNGETYNGHLASLDSFMNILLRDVICTSADGDKFWRLKECFIKGSNVKYIRVPDNLIDMVQEEIVAKIEKRKAEASSGRGGYRGRGRGRGRGEFRGRGRGGRGRGAPRE
eukprot:GCRY01001530.1.p1 GENE.GCRY01001530.1~~GCRY01001530.1.p1  ORF type:complete len:130 (+),score=4.00 GCRY01001530.1:129-518(+)